MIRSSPTDDAFSSNNNNLILIYCMLTQQSKGQLQSEH
jgi:hypothetical protein